MNDFYAEYLVEKRSDGKDTAKRILLLVGMTVLCIVIFLFTGPVGILLSALVVYGGYYLFTGTSTEYEYIITNGSFDVDKISGRRSRKRLISTEISTFTDFGKLADAPAAPSGCTTVLASDNSGGEDWYADLKHKSAGNVRIIFSPNEKIIEGVEMFLPRQLKLELRRQGKLSLKK
ncbi:MAG: hypothetical protein IKR73_05265 [Oscillospiraceae bacterium]|nr:hypothetical protein [Oscillospiraceae bacterium]